MSYWCICGNDCKGESDECKASLESNGCDKKKSTIKAKRKINSKDRRRIDRIVKPDFLSKIIKPEDY